jgi:hypothetical protein
MKSVKFWKMASKELSLTEQMFYRDAIRTLLTWDVLKDEYVELEIIRKVLDSEIPFPLSQDRSREEGCAVAAG